MTPEEMDKIMGAHYAAEAAHDHDAIIGTLTDDVRHDVVGWPGGDLITDPAAITQRYTQLFSMYADEAVTPAIRLYGENFLVDEVVFTGTRLADGQRVSSRLLHVCEFRDGRISRENVWQGPETVLENNDS